LKPEEEWSEKYLKGRLLKRRRIEGSCWEYTREIQFNGYGRMTYQGKKHLVHRLAAMYWLGLDLESDLLVHHACENRACFNPEHLRILTPGNHRALH
jgi:HNH endonuclease